MNYAVFYILLLLIAIRVTYGRPGLRMIGGENADHGKYPYVARLAGIIKSPKMAFGIQYCTGSVLTPIWTLTSAHCPHGFHDMFKIFMQENEVVHALTYGVQNTSVTVASVLSIFIHPSYKDTFYGNIVNDIALLKTEKVNLNAYGRVSALEYTTLIGQEAISFGYGLTNTSGVAKKSDTLKMIEVIAVRCAKKVAKRVTPAFCLARKCDRSAVVCEGDSGGPTIHPSGIIGVTTYRDHDDLCTLKKDYPVFVVGIITPTSPYVDWIGGIAKNLVAVNIAIQCGNAGRIIGTLPDDN